MRAGARAHPLADPAFAALPTLPFVLAFRGERARQRAVRDRRLIACVRGLCGRVEGGSTRGRHRSVRGFIRHRPVRPCEQPGQVPAGAGQRGSGALPRGCRQLNAPFASPTLGRAPGGGVVGTRGRICRRSTSRRRSKASWRLSSRGPCQLRAPSPSQQRCSASKTRVRSRCPGAFHPPSQRLWKLTRAVPPRSLCGARRGRLRVGPAGFNRGAHHRQHRPPRRARGTAASHRPAALQRQGGRPSAAALTRAPASCGVRRAGPRSAGRSCAVWAAVPGPVKPLAPPPCCRRARPTP